MPHGACSISNHNSSPTLGQSNEPCWYALYTYPKHEKAVSEQLGSKSMETFLPVVSRESRWKDRRVQIETPVFPSYVFVRLVMSERVNVFAVPGVIRLLSSCGKPARIEDSEIEAVKLCLTRGVTFESYPFLDVGDRVRVRSGALEGIEGFVMRHKSKCRLIISIAMINRSVAVEVDAATLESRDVRRMAS